MIGDDEIPVEVRGLETPQINGDRTSAHIKPFSAFELSFWQHIPGEVADKLVVDLDIELRFDFDELDIQLCKSGDPSARARLRLWGGARFVKLADHSCTNRSVIIRPGSGSVRAS